MGTVFPLRSPSVSSSASFDGKGLVRSVGGRAYRKLRESRASRSCCFEFGLCETQNSCCIGERKTERRPARVIAQHFFLYDSELQIPSVNSLFT